MSYQAKIEKIESQWMIIRKGTFPVVEEWLNRQLANLGFTSERNPGLMMAVEARENQDLTGKYKSIRYYGEYKVTLS